MEAQHGAHARDCGKVKVTLLSKRNAAEALTAPLNGKVIAIDDVADLIYNGTPMQSEGSTSDTVTVDGNSEFFQAISGRKSAEMWAVMGELMDTLQAINPRLYNSVMRKINS